RPSRTHPGPPGAGGPPPAAPSLSATGSMNFEKFARLCKARPPEMIIFAEVSSGRSDFDSCSPTKDERAGSAAAVIISTLADPPASAAWKVDVRTVITFFASDDFTV